MFLLPTRTQIMWYFDNITMSRRKSNVLLPFNVTATARTPHGLNQTSYAENVTYLRNKKTPAKRRRTQVEISRAEIEEEMLEMCEGEKGCNIILLQWRF